MRNLFLIFACLFIFFGTSVGQTAQKLKIYLVCNEDWLCDMDYLRKEFTVVDFVRDRFLCDVQIISNVQFNGNGGQSNVLCFVPQNNAAAVKDTMTYFNDVTTTDDIKRKKMLKYLQLGLIPYLVDRGYVDKLDLTIKADDVNSTATAEKDPWNFWQFSVGSSGFFDGDRNYENSSISNSLNISRETTKDKFIFEIYNSINRRKFTFFNADTDTTEIVEAIRDRQDMYSRYISKLSEHWGVGVQASFTRSIFDNIDWRANITPQIEYSILPYTDFNSQRLVVGYSVGPRYFDYRDTTIYLKTEEFLVQHTFSLISSFTKSWGNINLGAYWSNYLNDFDKNNFSLGGAVSWNIFKGFRFSIGGNYELVHDQISLPKYDATRDDLLTQRRLIATSYNYFMGIGFSYTFGSIYNSQVNPTFRGLNYSISF